MSLLSQGLLPRPIVQAALRTRAGLRALSGAIMPAQAQILDELAGIGRTVALHVVAKHRIADHLADGPKTKDQLGELTGLRPDLLERILSAVIAIGVFRVDRAGHYENNRLSEPLRDGVEGSIRSMAEYFGEEFNVRAWGNLPSTLATGEPTFDQVHGAHIWEYFSRHPEKGALFTTAMSELTALDAPSIAAGFPFDRFKSICDVAGGRGTLLAAILGRYPSMHGVLFDEAYVLDAAGPFLKEKGVAERVDRVVGNFFERIPTGSEAYLLKDILHDWDDARCRVILGHVRDAMDGDARLLLCETPIDHANPRYPAPISDLQMMAITSGGKQRTVEDFRALFASAGLELVLVKHLATPVAVFEARKA